MNGRHQPACTLLEAIAATWIRLWTGLHLLMIHGIPAVSDAWKHIWHEQPWDVLQRAASLAVPYPVISLTAAACGLVVASAGLLIGFLTRVSAILIVAILLGALYFLEDIGKDTELIMIYLTGPVFCAIAGPGRWSVDGWLKG